MSETAEQVVRRIPAEVPMPDGFVPDTVLLPLALAHVVVALLERVAVLERKLDEHTAAALPDTHPPF